MLTPRPPWTPKVSTGRTAVFLDCCSVGAFPQASCTGPAGFYPGAQHRHSGAHCCLMCWQVLNEVTEDNLIDLGPGSPAVVSPMVGNTAPPSSLSSQLAGLGKCLTGIRGLLCRPRPGLRAPFSLCVGKPKESLLRNLWESVFLRSANCTTFH